MRIAITGASGSLGTALLTRLTQTGAERLVCFSRDEQRRARMSRDFGWHPGVRVFAGDVRDRDRLADLFSGCEAVVHAAARKVVTAHPDEPLEMHQTNVQGTLNVVAAARAAGVGKLLLISSDKAVRAENVYGVTKALAEHLVVSENAKTHPQGLRMAALRYGNVLASTGSVLTVWRGIARTTRRFPLSDGRMTRFWVTLDQAVEFVLAALADLRGGEIFVPHIGAAPLTRLAEALLPDGAACLFDDIGIRPGGEKLHEELLSPAEARRARRRNAFYVIPPYQSDQMWDDRPWMGDPVGDDFSYKSDTWPWQLTAPEMRVMIGMVPEAALTVSQP